MTRHERIMLAVLVGYTCALAGLSALLTRAMLS
jgi:hypothetical protein